MITASIQTITPEWAAEQLAKRNGTNRRLRGWWAEALAAAMRRGEWITTHQGIAFAQSGSIIDGQHRLKGVVIAKRPVDMMVFHGVPDSAFSVLDIGVKRSVSDTTGLSKKTAEACRLAATITQQSGGSTTPAQVSALAEAGLGEIHERLIAYCSSNTAIYSASSMRVAACALVMDGNPEEYVFKLYKDLATQKLEVLPPIGYAFVRQVGAGKVSSSATETGGRYDLLARGLKVLQPQNSELSRIVMNEGDAVAARAFVRHVMRRSINSTNN